jgi:hypothetical protein
MVVFNERRDPDPSGGQVKGFLLAGPVVDEDRVHQSDDIAKGFWVEQNVAAARMQRLDAWSQVRPLDRYLYDAFVRKADHHGAASKTAELLHEPQRSACERMDRHRDHDGL